MLDVADLESDVDFGEYTPSESMPDEALCHTPGTASNAPSESRDDCAVLSTGGSETRQNEARRVETHDQLLKRLQTWQSRDNEYDQSMLDLSRVHLKPVA
jgi:hypothetical protein